MFNNWTPEAKLKVFEELFGEYEKAAQNKEAEAKAGTIHISETIGAAFERLNNPSKMFGLPTGYEKLDGALKGLAPGELIVVGGQTHHGKSLFVQNIIVNNALNSTPTLFYTLEMSPVENTVRLLSMAQHYGVDREAASELAIFYAEMAGSTDIDLLEEVTKKAQVVDGIKLLVIDHLHFFVRSSDNYSSAVSVATKRFKELARNLNIPVVLVSHVRRMNDSNRIPRLDDLMQSASIGQDADSVLMVWRDLESQDEVVRRFMTVSIKKNRRMGTLGDFVYSTTRDLTLDEQ